MLTTTETPSLIERLRTHRSGIYRAGKLPTATGATIDAWPTGVTEPAGEFLRDLILKDFEAARAHNGEHGSRPIRTIEIGLALGLSTLFILDALLTLNGSATTDGPNAWKHTAIDPYQHNYWGSAGTLAIEHAGVSDRLDLITEDSLLALPRLVLEVETGKTPRFDFAFVDGGHFFENAFIDTYYMHRLIRPGGLIIVDDIWMPGIRLAVAYFETNLGLQREPVDSRASKRFAALRVPEKPVDRKWDHFVDFTKPSQS